jgi:hypothetical protein
VDGVEFAVGGRLLVAVGPGADGFRGRRRPWKIGRGWPSLDPWNPSF